MNSLTVSKAADFARVAHAGQTRRGGAPYISHLDSVQSKLARDDYAGQVVAWLHDVLEDTPTTAADLQGAGIPDPCILAVIAMTKQKGETYTAYLARVKVNPIARRVKVADMTHNLSDMPKPESRARYVKGLAYLAASSEDKEMADHQAAHDAGRDGI